MIKNLLVAYNGSASARSALEAAVLMHRKYGAHITGLLAHHGQRDRFRAQPWVPENVREILAAAIAEEERGVEARFRAGVAGIAEDRTHWISLTGEPDRTAAQYAALYDLVIAGRHGADDAPDAGFHPERIALQSGRPVLVTPPDLDPRGIEAKAVVAWDGRRAAARAINDAMLILETKQEVDVLSVGDDIRPPLKGADVVSALSRHGVPARRVRREKRSRSIGADILTYCEEVGAGLLVMGAYEHSVFREEVMGGVTTDVLAEARIPVLISH